jgi:HSP20 family protein
MRSRFQAVALPAEVGEFADDVQQIFRELGRAFGPDSLIGECAPALDVYETDERLEIAVDLPGVDAAAVRIVIRGSAVLIAGEKSARRRQGDSNFHLVERGFGRFVRLVRLTTPCETAHARATLIGGELRITVPKMTDRRGQPIRVAITTDRPVA